MRRSVGDSAGDASQPGASPAAFYLPAEDGGFDLTRDREPVGSRIPARRSSNRAARPCMYQTRPQTRVQAGADHRRVPGAGAAKPPASRGPDHQNRAAGAADRGRAERRRERGCAARAWEIARDHVSGLRPDASLDMSPQREIPPPQEQRYFPRLSSWGYGEAIEWRFAEGGYDQQGSADGWTRVRMPLDRGPPHRRT
jgi:hypothetical protein